MARRIMFWGLCAFVASTFLGVQYIVLSREKLLADVTVIVITKPSNPKQYYRIWRQTIDDRRYILNDIVLDSLGRSTTFRNIPRTTFIKELTLETDSNSLSTINEIQVVLGKDTIYRTQHDILTHTVINDSCGVATINLLPNLPSKSVLPPIKNIVNWNGDRVLIGLILSSSAQILAFLGLFLILISTKNLVTKFITKQEPVRYVCLAVLVAFTKNSYQVEQLSGDLDPSWITGINWAKLMNWQWGTDIVFTYGPYSWLIYPSIIADQSALLVAFLVNLSMTGAAFYTLLYLIRQKYMLAMISYEVTILLVLVFLCFQFELADYTLLMALVLTTISLNQDRSINKIVTGNTGFTVISLLILAVLSLTKFSYAAVAICHVVVMMAVFAYQRRFVIAVLVMPIFAGFLVSFWWLRGQSIQNLMPFFQNGYEIVSGYTEAMATPIWDVYSPWFINVACIGFVLIACFVMMLLLTDMGRGWRYKPALFWSLLVTPVLFLLFKEGFVRFDPDHMAFFYSQLLLLTLGYYVLTVKDGQSRWPVFVVIFVCCTVAKPAQWTAFTALRLTFDADYRQATLTRQEQELIRDSGLSPAQLTILKTARSVDVIPYNISLLYAIGATWNSRPIIQSYSVYTPTLNQLNARHVAGREQPEVILHTNYSIDNRYAVFDEPNLFGELCRGYTPYTEHTQAFTLLKKQVSTQIDSSSLRLAQRFTSTLGMSITVPHRPGKHLLFSAQIGRTSLGKILGFLYKIQPPYAKIETNQHTYTCRIVARNMSQGVYVSNYIADYKSLEQSFLRQFNEPIQKITLMGDPLFYQPEVKGQFMYW